MENIDLNINNYELEDILNLFKLNYDFNQEDLKNAKKIVLKMHPDKSGLDKKYFIFYSDVYKLLTSIHNFKNNKKINDDIKYTNNYKYTTKIYDLKNNDNINEKNKALEIYLKENKINTDVNTFNKWFNKQFDKIKIDNEQIDTGYGDWLSSNESIEEQKQIKMSDMANEFYKKKKEIKSIIKYNGIDEIYSNNNKLNSFTDLNSNAPDDYSSDIFSNLNYQDLKKAHTETVIPITDDDYLNIPKYKNVNDYKIHRDRDNQNMKPLSESQAIEYLKNKTKEQDKKSLKIAHELEKKMEQYNEKNMGFWSNILKIKN